PLTVDFRNDERDAVIEPKRGRLVDADSAGGDRQWHELATPLRSDREEADVEIAGSEGQWRGLLDLEVPELLARGPPRGKCANARVSTVEKELERDPADSAGRADD